MLHVLVYYLLLQVCWIFFCDIVDFFLNHLLLYNSNVYGTNYYQVVAVVSLQKACNNNG